MISSRDLSLLPGIEDLRRAMQSMAMLGAILCPQWQYRCYSFSAGWDAGEQLGSMRNGSGDELFAHFGEAGCWLKGFAHEAPMTPYRTNPRRVWPGILDAVPGEFAACLREPAFRVEDATFCIWRCYADGDWQIGPVAFPSGEEDPDGSVHLLSNLDGRPETYQKWASEYYERAAPFAAVDHVFRHRPLTPELVAELNPESCLDRVLADTEEIGYPA